MRYSHCIEKVFGIGTDYFPLKSAGFQVKTVKLCKECRNEASKTVCGEHYSKQNRSNRVVVLNMQISKKDEDEEEPMCM